ncbi:MFS transporter [Marinomonas spartinae]|uniref:MFS transporter n=1 Tax=Marinomonas spartinae TaxID=1792290 RepID=UPI0009F5C1BE|nr:MFS transporter [Marinomonas spartinae]
MNNKTRVFAAVSLSFIMVYIDISGISVALPTLENVFNTTPSTIMWVVNIYILTRSALVFASGKISDIFSHKRCFLFGLALFCIASLICGSSPNSITLITFRLFQAIGATFLFTSGMSMVTLAYSKEQRGKMIGLLLSTSLISMAFAPIVGGLFIKYLSWRWIFYINLIAGFIVYLLLDRSTNIEASGIPKKGFDWQGFFSISLSTTLLSLVFINSSIWGWKSWNFIFCIVFAIVLLFLFIYYEKRSLHPVIDLSIFKITNFISGSLISTINQITTWLIFFTTIFLQKAFHYSPLTTGLLLTPLFFFGIISANLGGFLVDKFNVKLPLILGTGASLLGVMITLVLYPHITYLKMIPMLILTGTGMFMINGPVRTSILNQITKDKYGMVNSTLNGLRAIGGTVGFTFLTAVLMNMELSSVKSKLVQIIPSISSDEIHKLIGLLSNTPESLDIVSKYDSTAQHTIYNAVSSSYLHGFYWMLVVILILMLINFILSISFIKSSSK